MRLAHKLKIRGGDAMKEQMKELKKLKGIGEVLSRRLIESSYDSIAKVAAAEKKGLERIAGMNQQKVHSIVTQAREIMGSAEKSQHTWMKDTKTRHIPGSI
jgi:replicative superfamily II helicase